MVSSVNEQSSLHTSLSPSASRVILSKTNVAVIPTTTHVFASSFSTLISASPKISPTSSSKELGISSSVGKLFPTTDNKKQKTSAPPTTNAPRTKEPSKEKVTTDSPETDEPKTKEPTTEEIKTGVYSNYLVLLLFTSMFFFCSYFAWLSLFVRDYYYHHHYNYNNYSYYCMNLSFIFIFLFFNFFLVTFLDLSCFDRSFYFPGSFIACSTCFVSLSVINLISFTRYVLRFSI